MSDTAELKAVVRRQTASRPPLSGVECIPPKPPTGLPEDARRPPQRGRRVLPGVRSQGACALVGRPPRQSYPLCPRPVMNAETRCEALDNHPCHHTTVGAADTARAVTTGVTLIAKRKGERRRGGKTSTGRHVDSDAPLLSSTRRSAGSHQIRDAAEAAASPPLPGACASAPPAPGPISTQISPQMFSAPVLAPALAAAGMPLTNDGWENLLHLLLARLRSAHTLPQATPAAPADADQARRMPCSSTACQ